MDQIINLYSILVWFSKWGPSSQHVTLHILLSTTKAKQNFCETYFCRSCKARSHISAHVVHVSSLEQLVSRRAAWCCSCCWRTKHVIPNYLQSGLGKGEKTNIYFYLLKEIVLFYYAWQRTTTPIRWPSVG